MDLTPEIKADIDQRTYKELLAFWRTARIGEPMFQGQSGQYYSQRMTQLKNEDPNGAILASKEIGWRS